MAQFAVGDRVRVRALAAAPLHHRTPRYVQGHVGRITRVQGAFRDPSLLALHKPGLPKLVLYMVAFDQRDLWGPDGPDGDLVTDIYQPWLEPAWQEPTWQEPAWQEPAWQEPAWQEPAWQEPA